MRKLFICLAFGMVVLSGCNKKPDTIITPTPTNAISLSPTSGASANPTDSVKPTVVPTSVPVSTPTLTPTQSDYVIETSEGVFISLDDLLALGWSISNDVINTNGVDYSGKLILPDWVTGLNAEGLVGLHEIDMSGSIITELNLKGCRELRTFACAGFADGIPDSCFEGCSKLYNMQLGTFTGIGNSAFKNCESLVSFDIPVECLYLGAECFSGCIKLGTIIGGEHILDVSKSVFEGTSWYDNKTDDFVMFGDILLSWENATGDIELPSCLKVGDYAFKDNQNITTVTVSDKTVELGRGCFENCTNLKAAYYTQTTVSLGADCFLGCISLSSVSEHPLMEYIGWSAFENTNVIEMKEENGVTTISNVIVKIDEEKLDNNKLQIEGVTSIAPGVFENKDIATIEVSDNTSLKELGNMMFFGVQSDEVIIDGDYSRICDAAFQGAAIGKLEFTGNVKVIDDFSFFNALFKELVLPNGIERIGTYTFRRLRGIDEFIVPNTVNSLDYCSFTETAVKKFVINGNNLVIPYFCFYDNVDLEEVVINEGVTVIESNAFFLSGIKRIYINTEDIKIDSKAFMGLGSLEELYLPKSLEGKVDFEFDTDTVKIIYE